MSIDERLQAAFGKFKAKVKDEEKQRFYQLIKNVHHRAWAALEGETSGIRHAEFIHALSKLKPELSHMDKLPTAQSELAGALARVETNMETAADLHKLSKHGQADELLSLTRVLADGSLLGTGKWELLDDGWAEALVGWFEHLFDRAPFNTDPVIQTIPDQLNLCIAGDWGTGYWRTSPVSPAQAVAQHMVALQPDVSLHLGDVYYAGTAEQEKANLIDIWPGGSQGSYTLNSNHEMYDGAYSYFDALQTHFTDQQGCSYFALENSHWLVVGLDSAYASDHWDLYMEGNIAGKQLEWLKNLPARQGIIITSHHTGFDLKGEKTLALYEQVMDALNDANGQPRYQQIYWYWGHAHNAVVYNERSVQNVPLRTRCIGHAAIPYGNASELAGAENVAWYETGSANDPDIPVRVLCGFAQVQLDGVNLKETLIGEDGSTRWSGQNG